MIMKKILNWRTAATFGLLALAISSLIFACTACTTLEPTSINEETILTKSIICGHVRYIAVDKNGKSDIDVPNVGFEVKIFYGLPDSDGNVEYAVKTVTTVQDGYFETTLGCPAGKALTVKCVAEGKGDTYTANEDNKLTDAEAYFYATVQKSVDCGMAAYFKLDMAPTAYISEPGLK